MSIPPHASFTNLKNLLNAWRTQRHELVLNLQAIRNSSMVRQEQLGTRINMCCQCLLDYLCMGHFLIFTRLLQNHPGQPETAGSILHTIYWKIENATDLALSFNDKYDTDITFLMEEPSLQSDISKILRVMQIRFELEDMLIEIASQTGMVAEEASHYPCARPAD